MSRRVDFSVYLAAARAQLWSAKQVDRDIVQVLSGISDTAMKPATAAEMAAKRLKAHGSETV